MAVSQADTKLSKIKENLIAIPGCPLGELSEQFQAIDGFSYRIRRLQSALFKEDQDNMQDWKDEDDVQTRPHKIPRSSAASSVVDDSQGRRRGFSGDSTGGSRAPATRDLSGGRSVSTLPQAKTNTGIRRNRKQKSCDSCATRKMKCDLQSTPLKTLDPATATYRLSCTRCKTKECLVRGELTYDSVEE